MSVYARGDHDDGNIAHLAKGATQFETVDAGKHDVDKYDVGRCALKNCDCIFARRGFVNDPAFVFESKFDRGSNALVVLNG